MSAVDDEPVGCIGLADIIRPEAADAIRILKSRGGVRHVNG